MLKKELVKMVGEKEDERYSTAVKLKTAISDKVEAVNKLSENNKKIERIREAISSRLIVIEPEDEYIDHCTLYPELKQPVNPIPISEEIKLLRYLSTILRKEPVIQKRGW